ncbi:folate-binding protein YgfZ [Streptomonospora sp. PA3]|uniref:CAF17-like 4Fe-4S cluster assembly/insertion protein YgfZ n=1 Tax=Streptomonospora sp. PA3 TaxID=2607326 RepID=UPI0012DC2A3D|nr:glycine cleavage T C-terminal barrel domain-containing protein [Streptomonospora sp. PA3]MUL43315.1 folate-binding protein YgfZ [Streptomonospora sp. PA3]
MTSPLLTRPGAVAAAPPDSDVAAHYGEPVQEGRAMDRSAAWIDRGNRGVVRVGGPDRLSWLHSLTSQHLADAAPGTAAEALVLDTNGHIRFHLSLVEDGTAVWMHTEPGAGADLAAFLDSMRFMLRVEVEDLSDARAVLTLAGPDREAALALVPDLGADVPLRRTDSGVDLFLPAESVSPVAAALADAGIRPAGMWAHEAARIADHRPRLGLDTDHRAIPHEMGWVGPAVHLDKGCYPGQETVARVHNLGRPPRRLVLLHLDGTAERLPERGAAIELEGRSVGAVGSSARHHELGPIALGLVKRTVPTDAQFSVDGIAAGQEVVVPPDTGANADIRLRRRPA